MVIINYSDLFRHATRLHSLIPAALKKGYAFPPLIYQILVTLRCNLKCNYCFQQKIRSEIPELSLEEIRSIIKQLPRWSVLTLTGGEPFLRKDFYEILDYTLQEKKIKCNIITNASLLDDRFIRQFVEKRLFLLGISLDGIGSTHDQARNKPGLYNSAIDVIKEIQAVKKAGKSRYPLIDIKTLIMRENFGELYSMLQVADNLGADYLTLSLPKLSNVQFYPPYREDIKEICSAKILKVPEVPSRELKALEEQFVLIKNYQGRTRVRFYPYNMLGIDSIRKFYNNELKAKNFYPCFMPWSTLYISPYGEVYTCLSYFIGNVREQDLKRLWNSERYKNFRKMLNRNHLDEYCIGCCYSNYNPKL